MGLNVQDLAGGMPDWEKLDGEPGQAGRAVVAMQVQYLERETERKGRRAAALAALQPKVQQSRGGTLSCQRNPFLPGTPHLGDPAFFRPWLESGPQSHGLKAAWPPPPNKCRGAFRARQLVYIVLFVVGSLRAAFSPSPTQLAFCTYTWIMPRRQAVGRGEGEAC